MKSKSRSIIDSVRQRLVSVIAGPDYLNTIITVEGGRRQFDTHEMEQGVCVCVAYGGTALGSKAPGAPQQISELGLVIEAHKYKAAGADVQAEGLDLLADIEKAVLGDTSYLAQPYVMRKGMLNESEEVQISEDGNAIVATSVITIPFIKQYANPHEE